MTEEKLSATSLPRVEFVQEEQKAPQPLRMIASIVIIVLVTVVSFWLALNPQWVLRFGNWGYVGAFFISMVASATILLPAPGIAVVIAMGTALNPVVLGIVAGIGSAIGELSGYLAGASGRVFVPSHQREQFERLQRLTDRYGALLLFVLAAIPFPLFDFAGIIAGMIKMRVSTFIIAVSAGKSIKYIVMISLGAAPLFYLQHLFRVLSTTK